MNRNRGDRFDRLPDAEADRRVEGRPTRTGVLDFFEGRFGIDPATFADHSFWEKGAGKVWVLRGDRPTPAAGIEALGLLALRARQRHWKPTTTFVQRFGHAAGRNVIGLSAAEADRFLAGDDQAIGWDGDWGYLIATAEVGGGPAALGVGLFTDGVLRSQVPKHRRLDR